MWLIVQQISCNKLSNTDNNTENFSWWFYLPLKSYTHTEIRYGFVTKDKSQCRSKILNIFRSNCTSKKKEKKKVKYEMCFTVNHLEVLLDVRLKDKYN